MLFKDGAVQDNTEVVIEARLTRLQANVEKLLQTSGTGAQLTKEQVKEQVDRILVKKSDPFKVTAGHDAQSHKLESDVNLRSKFECALSPRRRRAHLTRRHTGSRLMPHAAQLPGTTRPPICRCSPRLTRLSLQARWSRARRRSSLC